MDYGEEESNEEGKEEVLSLSEKGKYVSIIDMIACIILPTLFFVVIVVFSNFSLSCCNIHYYNIFHTCVVCCFR